MSAFTGIVNLQVMKALPYFVKRHPFTCIAFMNFVNHNYRHWINEVLIDLHFQDEVYDKSEADKSYLMQIIHFPIEKPAAALGIAIVLGGVGWAAYNFFSKYLHNTNKNSEKTATAVVSKESPSP